LTANTLTGHDNGLIVFKLERERPAFAVHQDSLYYVRDKFVRAYDFNSGSDIGLLNSRKFGSPYVPPRTLSFNPAERAVILTISSDNWLYELSPLPTGSNFEVKESVIEGKRGSGQSAIFVARNRFAVLNKTEQVGFDFATLGCLRSRMYFLLFRSLQFMIFPTTSSRLSSLRYKLTRFSTVVLHV